jgi:copper transport protein
MAARPWHLAVLAAAALAVVAGLVPAAYAHPITIDSSPKSFSSVPSAPAQVTVSFTEPIELSYSTITVLAPDGSRVDSNDKHLVNGDTASIGVSLKPNLPDGVYTVNTKVLSAVDGHVVESAFTFGIGTTPATTPGQPGGTSRILSPAESASRFPGMVGQIVVVGAAFGTLWLWKPLDRVPWLSNAIASKRLAIDGNMIRLVIIGTALVLASNVATIVVQAVDIGASVTDAIATKFGMVWMTRMIESSILMIIALFVWRKVAKSGALPSRAEILAILVMGLAVLVTSSLTSHGAATNQIAALLLDFFHDVAASIWIGGLVLMGYVAVPKILSIPDDRVKSAAVSILIPRFSTIVVTILGLAIITGPLLLFMIESDLSLTLASTYGKILAIKLGLAGIMVAMGGYSQFVIQKRAAVAMVGGSTIEQAGGGRFANSLKAEAGVGIALLLMVSLMANGALPAGEFPQAKPKEPQAAFAEKPVSTAFMQSAYSSSGRVNLSIDPFVVGQNKFTLSFFGTDGKPATDVNNATLKMTQVEKKIGPIAIDTAQKSPGVFAADAAFSLPGNWAMSVEGVRPHGVNIVASLNVHVSPAISSLKFDVKEYKTPDKSQPLVPVYDAARQSIWASDQLIGSARLLQLDINTGNYTMHPLKGVTLTTQLLLDPSGKIWFLDPIAAGNSKFGKLGVYDPSTRTNKVFALPLEGVPSGIAQDNDGNLWVPIVEPNKVVKFNPQQEKFTQFDIPTPQSVPVGLKADGSGNIWMAESIGKIAKIDPATGKITEFAPKGNDKLDTPTAVFPEPGSSIVFVSEHGGHTVSAFNTYIGSFREYPTVNKAGLPFGMAQDSFGNLWFAEHEVDRVGVLDPRTGQGTEAKIPTSGSFIQWLASDDKGRIWFAEQRGAALGVITVIAGPPGQQQGGQTAGQNAKVVPNIGFSLADVAGPAIAAGIVLSALLYAKSAVELKRSVRAAEKISG